jgi:hypothetical protein
MKSAQLLLDRAQDVEPSDRPHELALIDDRETTDRRVHEETSAEVHVHIRWDRLHFGRHEVRDGALGNRGAQQGC